MYLRRILAHFPITWTLLCIVLESQFLWSIKVSATTPFASPFSQWTWWDENTKYIITEITVALSLTFKYYSFYSLSLAIFVTKYFTFCKYNTIQYLAHFSVDLMQTYHSTNLFSYCKMLGIPPIFINSWWLTKFPVHMKHELKYIVYTPLDNILKPVVKLWHWSLIDVQSLLYCNRSQYVNRKWYSEN